MEPKTVNVIPTSKSLDCCSKSSPPVFTLLKKIVCTPSKKIELIHRMGTKQLRDGKGELKCCK